MNARRCALGLLLLAIGTASVRAQAPKTSGLETLPANGFALATVSVSRLHDSDVLKPWLEALAKGDKPLLAELEKNLGLSLKDLDRVTLYWPTLSNGPEGFIALVSCRKPFDEVRLMKALQARPVMGMGRIDGPQHPGDGFRWVPGSSGKGDIEYGPKSLEPYLPKHDPKPPTPDKLAPPPPPKLPGGTPPGGPGLPGGLLPGGIPPDALPPLDVPLKKALAAPLRLPLDIQQVVHQRGPAPADWPHSEFIYSKTFDSVVYLADDRSLIVFPPQHGDQLGWMALAAKLLKPKPQGPLAEALKLADKHDVVVAVNIQELMAEMLLERRGDWPRELVPFRSLLKASQALITVDIAAKSRVQVLATYPGVDEARRAEPVMKTLIQMFVDEITLDKKQLAEQPPEIRAASEVLLSLVLTALDKAQVQFDGSTVRASLEADLAQSVQKSLLVLPEFLRYRASKIQTLNNLKQIGIALHTYHDATGFLPMDYVVNGKAMWSWRVELLPYLEQENLYRALDRTKPWDDPVNLKVLEKADMPKVFRVMGRDAANKHHTYFQMFSAPKPIPGGNPVLVPGRKLTLLNIIDGTSNTIGVIEAAEAVHWAKPGDLLYDPKKLPAVGNKANGEVHVLMLDGSVQVIKLNKLTDKLLQALITVDGGEVFTLP